MAIKISNALRKTNKQTKNSIVCGYIRAVIHQIDSDGQKNPLDTYLPALPVCSVRVHLLRETTVCNREAENYS